MLLKDISIPKVYYSLPKENITDEIFIPAIKSSSSFDVMTGYFSSGAIAELSTGLSHFLNHTKGKVRIVTCPQISENDQIAIAEGSVNTPEVLAKNFSDYIDDPYNKDSLEKYALECMSFLISNGRLELKLAYMKDKNSQFHKKINILSDDDNNTLVITGSTNFTPRGLRRNDEQARVERSWASDDECKTVMQIIDEFHNSWNNKETDIYVLCEAPEAIKRKIVDDYSTPSKPTIQNYDELINEIKNNNLLESLKKDEAGFKIPSHINYDTGDFKHQGKAINAWINSGYKGILQMCTGSGKTITSLICAIKLKEYKGKIIVVVAVPKEPLLHQWAKDIESFSGNPIVIRGTPDKKLNLVYEAFRRISRNTSDIEIIICTHNFLCDARFHELIENENTDILLIADEVHGLGTTSFIDNTPEMIPFRLGLSATPIRQYDETGTKKLFEFFGDICFKFDLENAIGICLVHYDYHVHPVTLDVDEMDRYIELTENIKKLSWAFKEKIENQRLNKYLRDRRLLLEQAKDKINRFKAVFSLNENRNIKHTLVFLSSKQHDQIDEINSYLQHDFGLIIHQVTGVETQGGISKQKIDDFKNEKIQVLTSMKVLDEGLNVPQIKTAYIIASTTSEREWTQRRGRVLRKCDEINKQKAVIHDFMVLAPNNGDFDNIIKTERKRITEFAKLSNNPWNKTGGLRILKEYYG